MSYQQLSIEERSVIAHLRGRGHGPREIGRQLGRAAGTISREIGRNRPGKRCAYQAERAAAMASERRASANGERDKCAHRPLWRVVIDKLKERWSPGLIADHLRRSHPGDAAMHVSAPTLYAALERQRAAGGRLHRGLPRRGRGRKPNGRGKRRRGPIEGRRHIDQRPIGAARRSRHGHWEGDTIEGAHKASYIVSLVDRKSRFTLLAKAADKSAHTVHAALASLHARLDPTLARTLTFDHGTEFSSHAQLEHDLNLRVYFADPNSPWQRGTNEQTNGLVRLFLPKGTDFRNVSHARLAQIEQMLNNRPRICLNHRTPAQVIPIPPRVALRI